MDIYSFMSSRTIKFVSPAEAKENIANGSNTLLDVRTDVEFAERRVPNSHHIPLDRLPEDCSELKPSSHIYLLCLGGKRATKAAETLREKGFSNLHVIEGGIDAWQATGFPVEKSTSKTLPLMRQVQLVIGVLALIGSLLAIFINPLFAILPAFLGAGLTLAGSTGWCGLALFLSKMPWNKTHAPAQSCCAI